MASPPPPIPPSRTSVDLARCFTFVTDDPAWVSKILIGGVFTFATTFLVGAFFVGGYWSRLLRRVAAGEARPLPEWDDLGGLFEDGLPIVGLLVLYGLAVFVVTAAPAAVTTAILAGARAALRHASGLRTVVEAVGAVAFLALSAAILLVGFVVNLLLPAALARAAFLNRFREGFAWPEILAFLRANAANYALAILAYFVASFASQLGLLFCCVGIFPAVFWAYLILAYGLGDALRLQSSS